MKRLAAAVAMVVASASMASASGMSIFTAPDKTYANTVDTPCIFYGPGNSGCNKDPSGWLTPAGPTNGSFNPLTQTYAGTDYTEWNSVVGSTFVLGFDVNDTSTPQTLAQMRIEYFSAGNALLGADEFAPATLTPSNANGTGWADYVQSRWAAQARRWGVDLPKRACQAARMARPTHRSWPRLTQQRSCLVSPSRGGTMGRIKSSLSRSLEASQRRIARSPARVIRTWVRRSRSLLP